MKKLENLFSLPNQVKVYVPSTMDINKEIDNTSYVNKGLELLSNLFGGATTQKATGAWVSPIAGLVKEQVDIVYAYAEELTDKAMDEVIGFCEGMKSELSQDAIALEVNNRLYFI